MEYERSLPLIRENQSAANTAQQKLMVFLGKFSEVSEAALKEAIVVAKGRVEACQAEMAVIQAKEAEANEEKAGLVPKIEEKVKELQIMKGRQAALSGHYARHEEGRDDRLQRQEELETEITALLALVTGRQEVIDRRLKRLKSLGTR